MTYNCVPQYTRINAGDTISYKEYWQDYRFIYFRYENDTRDSFSYEFSTKKVGTSIILTETRDRSQIQMHCTSDGGSRFCPNYGKFLQASVPLYTIQPKVCAPLTITPMYFLSIPFQIYFPFVVLMCFTLLVRLLED